MTQLWPCALSTSATQHGWLEAQVTKLHSAFHDDGSCGLLESGPVAGTAWPWLLCWVWALRRCVSRGRSLAVH